MRISGLTSFISFLRLPTKIVLKRQSLCLKIPLKHHQSSSLKTVTRCSFPPYLPYLHSIMISTLNLTFTPTNTSLSYLSADVIAHTSSCPFSSSFIAKVSLYMAFEVGHLRVQAAR